MQTKEEKKFKDLKEVVDLTKQVTLKECSEKIEHQKGDTER